jgi:hypothetical protein
MFSESTINDCLRLTRNFGQRFKNLGSYLTNEMSILEIFELRYSKIVVPCS